MFMLVLKWASLIYTRKKVEATHESDTTGFEPGGGGVFPEKFGRGVRPASQNAYPIYDQNLRLSLPYLWPDQKFDTLFMTWLLDH